MFFIGLFSSPFPLLLMLGVYLFGYVCFELKGRYSQTGDNQETIYVSDYNGNNAQPDLLDFNTDADYPPEKIDASAYLAFSANISHPPGEEVFICFNGNTCSSRPPPC